MMRPTTPLTMLSCLFILSSLSTDCMAYRDNPFAPLPSIQSTNQSAQYKLHMLVVTEKKRAALINDQVVMEGDYLDDAKVLLIATDHVILSRAGNNIVLKAGQ